MSQRESPIAGVDVASLDFESFVRFAEERVRQLAPEVDVEAMSLVLSLHRSESVVVYDIESTVHRPAGWSWAGFRLLFALWLCGPLEVKHAARLSGNSRQATSTLANTLERAGLLRRTTLPHDRRLVEIALTEAGVEAISSTYQAHNEREQLWASVLTPEERAAVTSALEKLLALAPGLDVRRRSD